MNNGKDKISLWFSLSYASWLTIPRVLIEDMPDEWQSKMADLLNEYDEAFPNQPDISTIVQGRKGNKFVKMPEGLLNYRRPNRQYLSDLRGQND